MTEKRSLAVARLWLEVNSFSPLPTGSAEFEETEWARGDAALAAFDGTPTELGAVAAFMRAHPNWQASVSRCAAAAPGGPMEDALFDAFVAEVLDDLRARRFDAVYLSLHGALVTPTRPCPELDLIRSVRAAIGDTPLGVSFDMHANLGGDLAELVTVSSGYRTLPHVDMDETAAKVLRMLVDTVEGRIRPVGRLVRPGRILHSFNMRTEDGPMRVIEEAARALETAPVLDVTPYGGFPYADTPHTGASVLAYADAAPEAAARAAEAVADVIREQAPGFAVVRPSAEAGLRRALDQAPGPVAVLESADNTYSGGIADTPALLRALLAFEPRVPAVFAYFHDPELVARARAAGEGATLACRIGARITDAYGPPIATEAKVLRLTEGTFRNHGPMYAGVEVDYGHTAVLGVDNVQIIVTSRRLPVNDTAFFALHGIDLAETRLLCVKAKNHFRAAFGPHCAAFIEVDTIGPAAIRLDSLPYRHAATDEFV